MTLCVDITDPVLLCDFMIKLASITNLIISGCGTSLNASMYGAKLMREFDAFTTVQHMDAAEIRGNFVLTVYLCIGLVTSHLSLNIFYLLLCLLNFLVIYPSLSPFIYPIYLSIYLFANLKTNCSKPTPFPSFEHPSLTLLNTTL